MDGYTWDILVDGQIYLLQLKGDVDGETLAQISSDLAHSIETSDSPLVHLIVDVRQTTQLPSLPVITQMRYPYNHPHMGFLITLQAFQDPVSHALISLAAAVMRLKHKEVETLEEAYVFLAQKDASLPAMEAWTLPGYVPTAMP